MQNRGRRDCPGPQDSEAAAVASPTLLRTAAAFCRRKHELKALLLPRWKVKFSCDEARHASAGSHSFLPPVAHESKEQGARSHAVPVGENFQTFDVLMGCDGARSRVRESQKQIFGEDGAHWTADDDSSRCRALDCMNAGGQAQLQEDDRSVLAA